MHLIFEPLCWPARMRAAVAAGGGILAMRVGKVQKCLGTAGESLNSRPS